MGSKLRLCGAGAGSFGGAAGAGGLRGGTVSGAREPANEARAMKPSTAFDICHEVYAAAREIMDSRMATVQMAQASKFLWRPGRRPPPGGEVVDIARAG